MDMRKILFIFLISIILCSVQSLAAAEISDTDNANIFELSDDVVTVDSGTHDGVLESIDDEVVADSDSEDALAEGEGSFTELENEISSATGTITLEKDYAYTDSDDTSGIKINKNIVIDGAGHTIDGKGLSRLFDLVAKNRDPKHTITLKNLNLINGAQYNGAGINVGKYNELIVENCNFTNNIAGNRAGAIYSPDPLSNVTVKNSNFIGNKATADNGGALYGLSLIHI